MSSCFPLLMGREILSADVRGSCLVMTFLFLLLALDVSVSVCVWKPIKYHTVPMDRYSRYSVPSCVDRDRHSHTTNDCLVALNVATRYAELSRRQQPRVRDLRCHIFHHMPRVKLINLHFPIPLFSSRADGIASKHRRPRQLDIAECSKETKTTPIDESEISPRQRQRQRPTPLEALTR